MGSISLHSKQVQIKKKQTTKKKKLRKKKITAPVFKKPFSNEILTNFVKFSPTTVSEIPNTFLEPEGHIMESFLDALSQLCPNLRVDLETQLIVNCTTATVTVSVVSRPPLTHCKTLV